MKDNEKKQLVGEELVESLRHNNHTGVSAENLAKIVEAHRANIWSDPIDIDDYIKHLEAGGKP